MPTSARQNARPKRETHRRIRWFPTGRCGHRPLHLPGRILQKPDRKPAKRLRAGKEEAALENKRRRLRRLVSSKPFLTRASAPTSPRKAGFRKTENPAPKQGRGQSRYHPDRACAHLSASVSGSVRRARRAAARDWLHPQPAEGLSPVPFSLGAAFADARSFVAVTPILQLFYHIRCVCQPINFIHTPMRSAAAARRCSAAALTTTA